jgi:hypothetical protein
MNPMTFVARATQEDLLLDSHRDMSVVDAKINLEIAPVASKFDRMNCDARLALSDGQEVKTGCE